MKGGILHLWIQQYALCALVELQELEESTTEQNSIVEMIDIWHFIMSLIQVSGTTYDQLIEFNENQVSRFHDEDLDAFFKSEYVDAIKSTRADLRQYLYEIITNLPWKHWSKKTEFNYPDVFYAINKSMWSWFRIAKDMGLDSEKLHSVYIQKNKVNEERQNTDYGSTVKTEDDNQKIVV